MIGNRLRRVVDDLRGDGRGWILVIVSTGWFFSLGIRLIYPVILPQVTEEFAITYESAGISLSVLWVCYALMSVPGGLLADRFGERILLLGSTVVVAVGVVAVGLAPSFGTFVLATALLGSGTGLFGTTGTTVLTDLYTDRDATAISISQSVGTLGTILLPIGAGAVAVLANWRFGIGYVLPGLAAVAVGLWLVVPARTSPAVASGPGRSGGVTERLWHSLSDRAVVPVIAGLTCVGFAFQGMTGFLPTYLIDVKGFTPTRASTLFGFFFTAMIVSKLSSGPIADRYGVRPALLLFLVLSAPGMFVLPFADSTFLVVPAVWIAGLVIGYTPVAMVAAITAIPDDIKGSGFGVVRATFIGLGALAPPIVGRLADKGAFDVALLVLGVAVLVGIGFTLFVPDRR